MERKGILGLRNILPINKQLKIRKSFFEAKALIVDLNLYFKLNGASLPPEIVSLVERVTLFSFFAGLLSLKGTMSRRFHSFF